MDLLFPQVHSTEGSGETQGPIAAVALEQGIDHLLDYSIPPKMVSLLQVGMRVKVPLGRTNKPVHAYVIMVKERSEYPRIKPLFGIDDDRVLIDPRLMELALWMSRYYVTPLGTVLESVIPSAVKKRTGAGYLSMVRPKQTPEQLQVIFEKTKAPKRRAVLAKLLLVDPSKGIELSELANEAGSTPATVRKLADVGVIEIKREIDLSGLGKNETNPLPIDGTTGQAKVESDIHFNADQQKVFDELVPRMVAGEFSVNLILGVTGSGKTEVYLQCIRRVIEQGKQAIVLVPEIALTPQTVRRFTARFPKVAVLHSGLTQSERHHFWQQISTGGANVVVGARSAVFAPMPKLGVMVIDEEHESSYKQDTAPRYHARDVAIKRAQLEGVPVILGSATPSMEMYRRASEKPAVAHYHLLHLPRRVRNLAMPHVELIDMKQEGRFRRGIHLISVRLESLLKTTLQQGHQAIMLLNRRGYSNFVYCASCQEAIGCKYCDATMTYHRAAGMHPHGARTQEGVHTGQLHCHYCLASNPLPEKCPKCDKRLTLFGLGTQRVEEELNSKFPDLKYIRVDSDTMRSSRDYEATLGKFARNEVQLLLGTQMIAKGLDFPNITLVGVISGDTALALPDFRASERTFQLLTQVAGRAGRGDAPGRVILQTFLPDDPTIQFAIKQDYVGFAARELSQRKEVGLPPFSRMARIVIRDSDQNKLHQRSEEVAEQLAEAVAREGDQVRMKGPMPCAITRIAGYFRNQIVLSSPNAGRLQRALACMRQRGNLAKSDRIAVDVDPVSLL